MAKFCSNCGNPLDDAAKFCMVCGTKCPEAPQPAQQSEVQAQPFAQAPRVNNKVENTGKKSGFSAASLIIAVLPLVILLLGFLFCFILSGGSSSDNDAGAIWWLFIAMLGIIVPASILTNLLSVILGIIGILKSKKTVFAWSGIVIAGLELLTILALWLRLK